MCVGSVVSQTYVDVLMVTSKYPCTKTVILKSVAVSVRHSRVFYVRNASRKFDCPKASDGVQSTVDFAFQCSDSNFQNCSTISIFQGYKVYQIS